MNTRVRFPDGWDPKTDGGYLMAAKMDDGRYWCLMALTLGRLRIVIAEDYATAGEHWCYDDNVAAVKSFFAGPQEAPVGWSRHMRPDGSFERRGDELP